MLDHLRSVVAGVDWPAVPDAPASTMLAVQFQLERSEWLGSSDLWALQRRQLRSLLRHAVTTVPYYQERIRGLVSSLASDFSPEDFSQFPLLSRSVLQAHFSELRSSSLPPGHGSASEFSTSGSTGEPVRFVGTMLAGFFWHAILLREHFWHQRDFSADMLAVRVENEVSVLDNWFGEVGRGMLQTGRCIVVPARWTFDRQLDRILQDRPAYLLSYASNLLGILRTADRRNEDLSWLREVRSFGEAVPDEMRQYIRDRWKFPLSDVYSARETGYLAIQCAEYGTYHVQSECAVVEVVNEDGNPCRPGETGRVVVTPLHNFGMPLIRYDIGDLAEVGEKCRCGRSLPSLTRIRGRRRNLLTLPDGSKRWPTIGTSKLLDIAPIRRFKFVQKSLSEIEVRLIVDRPLVEAELAGLRGHLGAQFGTGFHLKFVFFDEFPPQRGDKFEDFVSELP